MGRGGCAQVAFGGGRSSAGADAQDLLRLERFGGLYYSRRDCGFYALRPHEAELLLLARETPIFEVYAEDPEGWGIEEPQLIQTVMRWRQAGFLDPTYRCPARIIRGDTSHRGLIGPMATNLQLTRACNLRCTHCYVDVMAKPSPDELSTEQILSLFAELDALGSPLVVLAGGEPMVRRDFWDIVEGVRTYGMDAWLCTNATMIDEDRANRLAKSALRGFSISLDGPDAATHEYLRGSGRFEDACRGISNLVEAGAADVQVRVTVTPHNADRLLDFADVARRLGVDKVVFKPFRQSGAADREQQLFIDMGRYHAALDAARERWPDDAPAAEFGDGMPQRPPRWTRIIPAFGCVGGTTTVTVTYDGKVTGCGSVPFPEEWTLHDHSFGDSWRKAPGVTPWRELPGNDGCRSCHNFVQCGGGCRARAVGVGRSIDDPDPWSYCADHEPAQARPTLPILA